MSDAGFFATMYSMIDVAAQRPYLRTVIILLGVLEERAAKVGAGGGVTR